MDILKKCYEYTEVEESKKTGLYPYFHALQTAQDTEVMMDGKRIIMIGSNNYMGLTNDPRTAQAAKDAIDKYGTGCSGSRFLNGTLELHEQLEAALADFFHKENALTFSTGFQSNLGIISSLVGRRDYIFNDGENHASIVDACRLSFAKKMLRFEHNDMDALEAKLARIPEDAGKLIITDGVFSMSGDIAKLPELVELAKKYDATLMVDDAHGVGMIGKNGRGTASHFGLEDEVDIIMTTFSKSLASLGGCMAADEAVINYVKHKSRPFIFSASIPPGNAAAAMEALKIMLAEPQRQEDLIEISNYMRAKLKEAGIPIIEGTTAIIPVFTYDMTRTFLITKMLFDAGVYVNPVIPPAVKNGECMLRTSYTATHTQEQMDTAVEAFKYVFGNVDDVMAQMAAQVEELNRLQTQRNG
ncbi:MAG: aminotransferase class I/II-fold pyridoxal phosphate-dependent enzyme [Clostridia bacterium]|nr:aminotransferase class I/II-fold pyridoxal phosphate-dependent enzyme [Clostridia bacterium]MBT7121943.1 aminotransferase class I/II-fold pyridoxal phosphate-dependent enzyme [Clostridia bacterium]